MLRMRRFDVVVLSLFSEPACMRTELELGCAL